jgi:hypothetical protein
VWAHANGCPCDSRQYCIARLVPKSNSSSGSSNTSSSCSSRRDDAGYDLYAGVDIHNGYWASQQVDETVVEFGRADGQAVLLLLDALLLLVAAAAAVLSTMALQSVYDSSRIRLH